MPCKQREWQECCLRSHSRLQFRCVHHVTHVWSVVSCTALVTIVLPPPPSSDPSTRTQIYSVESHRLALALDRRGLLVQIVRSAVLQAMGLTNKDNMRLANLF